MWYRIKGNTEKCVCGEVAEKWVRLTGAKPVIRVFICPTCHPQLTNLVSRSTPIARDRMAS